jgi:hypothetical protein
VEPFSCEWHGPLRFHEETRQWGPCPGFDGEGCSAGPVSVPAALRLIAGLTYWPGITVNGELWQAARARLKDR